jgi:hypothetical protein
MIDLVADLIEDRPDCCPICAKLVRNAQNLPHGPRRGELITRLLYYMAEQGAGADAPGDIRIAAPRTEGNHWLPTDPVTT